MIEALKRNWWVLVIRGICGIVFGATAGRASDPDWGFHLIIGLLGVVVGFLTFRAPGITALILVIYIGAWALMIGAVEIALAIKLRRELKGEWLLILMGLASIIFAAFLLWNPGPGALALLWVIGSYAIVFGILGVIFGLRLRSLPALPLSRRHLQEPPRPRGHTRLTRLP